MYPEKLFYLPCQAVALYTAMIDWCYRHDTNGELEKEYLPLVYRPVGSKFRYKKAMQILINSGLITTPFEHYMIPHFLYYKKVRDLAKAAEMEQNRPKEVSQNETKKAQNSAFVIENIYIRGNSKPNINTEAVHPEFRSKTQTGPRPYMSPHDGVTDYIQQIIATGWKGNIRKAQQALEEIAPISEWEMSESIHAMKQRGIRINPGYAIKVIQTLRKKAGRSYDVPKVNTQRECLAYEAEELNEDTCDEVAQVAEQLIKSEVFSMNICDSVATKRALTPQRLAQMRETEIELHAALEAGTCSYKAYMSTVNRLIPEEHRLYKNVLPR